MEVPRLGVQLELQLPAYATATAMPDLSRVYDLCHSSRQCRILNPLCKSRDQTRNFMVPSQVCFRCATTGTPLSFLFQQHPQHIKVPGPGTESKPQLQPQLLQVDCATLLMEVTFSILFQIYKLIAIPTEYYLF